MLYCANCAEAKVYRDRLSHTNTEGERKIWHYVKCKKNHWKRKTMLAGIHKLKIDSCPDYQDMGDGTDGDLNAFLVVLPHDKVEYEMTWLKSV